MVRCAHAFFFVWLEDATERVFFVVVLEIAKYSKIFDFHSQFAALLFLSSFIVVLGFAGAKRLAFSSSLSLIREC